VGLLPFCARAAVVRCLGAIALPASGSLGRRNTPIRPHLLRPSTAMPGLKGPSRFFAFDALPASEGGGQLWRPGRSTITVTVRCAASPDRHCIVRLRVVGQFFEQSVPIGNVPCLPTFQSPEKRLCAGRIMSASHQRFDHFALMGDVSLSPAKKAFGFLQELLQGDAVHAAAYQPNRRQGPSTIRA
jgi:hypothetical protein